MFISTPNITILIILILFILISTTLDKILLLCVKCFGDCGYCTGCHTLIDCWTYGFIKSYFSLSIIFLILYTIIFIVTYHKKNKQHVNMCITES